MRGSEHVKSLLENFSLMRTTPMTPRCTLGRSEILRHTARWRWRGCFENSFTSCRTLSETLEPIPPGRRIGLRRGATRAPVQVPRPECGPSFTARSRSFPAHSGIGPNAINLRGTMPRLFGQEVPDLRAVYTRRASPMRANPAIMRALWYRWLRETATDSRRLGSNDAAKLALRSPPLTIRQARSRPRVACGCQPISR